MHPRGLARRARPRLLAAALALALAGCPPSDPKDPRTWISLLQSRDPELRGRAISELRKLHERAAAQPIAALLRDPASCEAAAAALAELGGAESVPPLIDAIQSSIGGGAQPAQVDRANARIANALGRLGDERAVPALLRLARSKHDAVRVAAVEALGQLRARTAVSELVTVVDDESASPLLIKKAVAALGQIGDPGGVSALAHALVLDRQGVGFSAEAALAAFQIGAPAVEPFLRIEQDQDPAFLAWAREHDRAPAGTYARAALVLGDLGDARAAPALIEKLRYADPEKDAPTARLLTSLVRQSAADALGRLRAKEATAPLLALLQAKEPLDGPLVLAVTRALAWTADAAAARELVRRAEHGPFVARLACARAAALLGEPELKKELAALVAKEKSRGRGDAASCARDLAELSPEPPADLKPRDLRACDELQKAREAALAVLVAPLEAAQACARAAPCWAEKLAAPVPLVRARAARELADAGFAQAVPALVKAAADPDLGVRLAAVRSLDALAALPAAQPLLKAQAGALATQLAEQAALFGGDERGAALGELRRLQARIARL